MLFKTFMNDADPDKQYNRNPDNDKSQTKQKNQYYFVAFTKHRSREKRHQSQNA